MSQPYTSEFKKKIVRLHEEEGRTIENIMSEDGIAKSTISRWCRELREECQKQAQDNPEITTELDMMKENLRLRKELEELRKENLFLKKAAAFFAKEID